MHVPLIIMHARGVDIEGGVNNNNTSCGGGNKKKGKYNNQNKLEMIHTSRANAKV